MKVKLKRSLLVCFGILFCFAVAAGIFVSRDPTLLMLIPHEDQAVPLLNKEPLGADQIDEISLAKSIDLGIAYLKSTQKEDGSWLSHPGITGICLTSILQSPRRGDSEKSCVDQALGYLLKLQQEDGAIYIPFSVSKSMANYVTSYALMAFCAADRSKYKMAIEKASKYLLSAQRSGEDYDKNNPAYGGLSYGLGGSGADLSNLHSALQALKDAGVNDKDPFFQRALTFASRCQDSEGNDLNAGTSSMSGGFVYRPEMLTAKNENSDDAQNPYGSMAFAGLESLLLCQVEKSDSRIVEAMKWISENYSVEENPGKGRLSLFYYYATMAKALNVAGVTTIETKNGPKVWSNDLAQQLLKQQREDGSWVNSNPKYFEGYPEMATAYAISALNSCWGNVNKK